MTPTPAQIKAAETDGQLLQRLGADAALWAAEFRKTAIKLSYSDMDEGWLIGWFANAIENAAVHRTAAAEVGGPTSLLRSRTKTIYPRGSNIGVEVGEHDERYEAFAQSVQAAEVGDRYEEGFNDGWEEAKSNAEAAAAEVGEPETPLDYMLRHSIANNNATIELCAQVAEQWQYDKHPTCKSIAAAIRMLKDKP